MEDKEAYEQLGSIIKKQMVSLNKYIAMFPEEKEGIDAEQQLIEMQELRYWLRLKWVGLTRK